MSRKLWLVHCQFISEVFATWNDQPSSIFIKAESELELGNQKSSSTYKFPVKVAKVDSYIKFITLRSSLMVTPPGSKKWSKINELKIKNELYFIFR